MTLDKYAYYQLAVQSPDVDAAFLDRVYKELRGKPARALREDFCAAFALCCEWTRIAEDKEAFALDLDPEPLAYGREHYLSKLPAPAQKRVHIVEADVLKAGLPEADIIAALNFSYFIFKERATLKTYFENCMKTLKKDGLLVLDCFGGPACMEPNEHETEYDTFSYYWDQDTFDPLTNHAQFAIHFRLKGKKKVKNVFTYDWRLWGLPELHDLLMESGFQKVDFYWEGTDEDGEGDGNYTRVEKGEICESYVAYLIASK